MRHFCFDSICLSLLRKWLRNTGSSCLLMHSVPREKRTCQFGSYFGGIPPPFSLFLACIKLGQYVESPWQQVQRYLTWNGYTSGQFHHGDF